jgi:cholesterol transport system auxiliary component
MMRRFLTIAACGLLSACSLSLTGKAPPFMLTLTPAQLPPATGGAPIRTADVLNVTTPIVPQAIAANRVPVAQSNAMISYVKDAVWVEPPARLFQRLISETVRARTGRTVVDSRQLPGGVGLTLSGHLLRFDVEESGARAIVVYDATLVGGGGKVLRTRRFEASEAVGVIDARSVGPALNRAANVVAADVSAWIGS